MSRLNLPQGDWLQITENSALGRAIDRVAYKEPDLSESPATYAFGIAKNHYFLDGDKRVILSALVAFLGSNGLVFVTDEAEVVVMIRSLASGEIDEASLTRWIRDYWVPS